MFKVSVNLIKNRLYLTVGSVKKERVDEIIEELAEAVDQLERGFTCVTHIVDVRNVADDDLDKIMKVQDFLSERGAAAVARVGAEVGKQILDCVGEDTCYVAFDAESVSHAETMLDKWKSR